MRPHEHYTDEELVRLLLSTRDEALRAELWVEFWRRFQPVIAGVIVKSLLRRTRYNRALADDLVSESFLKICKDDFKALREFEFRHETALYGFVKVMALNALEDHFRKDKSNKRGGGRPADDLKLAQATVAATSDSVESIHNHIQLNEIHAYLQQLRSEPNFDRDYKIFCLYYRDGLTAQAISQLPEIGLTVKGVESTLLRLIRWLRGKMRPPGML